MKLKIIGLGLICLLAIILYIIYNSQSTTHDSNYLANHTSKVHPVIEKFYDQHLFRQAVTSTGKVSNIKNIKAGIIPHHLVAGTLIADFFQRVSVQEIKTVILIGPNHEELGGSRALSSKYGWQTPFGYVLPNLEIVNQIEKHQLVSIDESVLSQEHSVGGIMPFIKYYLPHAQVVPLIVSSQTTLKEVDQLSRMLSISFWTATKSLLCCSSN